MCKLISAGRKRLVKSKRSNNTICEKLEDLMNFKNTEDSGAEKERV